MTKSKTREQILDAAMNRIKHYGYGKTTMSEIAGDCGMSAGNIYRFFIKKMLETIYAKFIFPRRYGHRCSTSQVCQTIYLIGVYRFF